MIDSLGRLDILLLGKDGMMLQSHNRCLDDFVIVGGNLPRLGSPGFIGG